MFLITAEAEGVVWYQLNLLKYPQKFIADRSIMLTCPCDVDPPYTQLLYSKTGVYMGIYLFLIFALKHRLWVLVTIASVMRF